MIELERRGPTFLLCMREDDNRLNPDFVRDFGTALDEVEKAETPKLLVTTGDGKFFSNGLDLAWMSEQSSEVAGAFLADLYRLWARILTFPVASVAAINGHAFAGGAMLSLAHDFRVMRADRGYFCIPEIDLKLPLSPEMTALLRGRLPLAAAHEAILTGRRYGGEAARERGLVQRAVPEAELIDAAIEMIADLAEKDGPTMAALKRGLYADTVAILEGQAPPRG